MNAKGSHKYHRSNWTIAIADPAMAATLKIAISA